MLFLEPFLTKIADHSLLAQSCSVIGVLVFLDLSVNSVSDYPLVQASPGFGEDGTP